MSRIIQKYYLSYIVIILVFCILMLACWIGTHNIIFIALSMICLLISAGIQYFFRDPDRKIPEIEGTVTSPADGIITHIQHNIQEKYCNHPVTVISIFLRLWDVHINRIPITGNIEKCIYEKGRFYAAMSNKASKYNEKMLVLISSSNGYFLIKQVAGMIARRIVCFVKQGDSVVQGERFGLIKFGSLVELSIPSTYHICVKENQKVCAGETIVASLVRK